MNLWTVALTIYMTCCIQAAMSQGETVFSISLNAVDQTVDFNFSETMFIRFYHCLRNKDHTLCYVQRNNEYEVTTVKTCLPVGSSQIKDAFTCRPLGNGFVCKGVNFPPPGVDESKCTVTYDIRDDATLSQQVRLTWDGVNSVTMENHAMGITVSFGNKIYEISGEFTSKVTTTAMTTTTTTVKTTSTHLPVQASTIFPLVSPTTPTPGTDKQKSDGDGDDSDIAITIGATVGGVVILAIIVIIVIILWRRKKGPSSSPTTDNNKRDDTDIYLNSGSTLGNIKPNPNSNEVTYYSNELTPHNMHATEEKNKNPNETASSDSCAANSDHNRSQQKKPQMSPYLNYTEAAIDNDAGLYSQSSSDANNGKKLTASTPDPSAKATYYNFLS